MRTPTLFAFAAALCSLSAHAKDPALGATTFTVYEAFLSPAQEPGEESETPKPLQKSLGALDAAREPQVPGPRADSLHQGPEQGLRRRPD